MPAGKTRSRVYKLAQLSSWQESFDLRTQSEDAAWQVVAPHLGPLPDNIRRIWQYGFTEMFNNAIDHSGSDRAFVAMSRTATTTEVSITDFGVGIFRKIQKNLDLLDERHAVLELAKGKFTTDPKNHSGEGIFFTSRIFDQFRMLSGKVFFSHRFGSDEDWILGDDDGSSDGTRVTMILNNHTARSLSALFHEYADVDEGFSKTVVPVRLATYGDDNLTSRSQAKRLLARFDRFRVVMLDFSGVDSIGQAFADQVFRVFAEEHPEVTLMPYNAEPEVAEMIGRAKSTVR